MSTAIYLTCAIAIVLIVFFLIAGTTYTLRRAYMAMKADMMQQKKMLRLISLGFALWLLITMVLSLGGYYENFRYLPPRIFLFGILPPLVITFVLIFSKSFLSILRYIPSAWLIKVQSFRIAMELMLWLAYIGLVLPFQMTFVGFNMDIIAGITALFAGSVFFRKRRFFRPEAVIWNVFGILLLINVVFIAVISTPTDYRVFLNEPSTAIIATFPYIWIPTFIVPYALAMHIFSIRQVFMKDLRPFEG
ncbi:MAG: hypothetical protein AAGJ18_03105 [Bacteroidota bacterium]